MAGEGSAWLAGLEERAAAVLAPEVRDYVALGSGRMVTLREAEAAWRIPRLAPHVLRDTTTVDLSVDLLGTRAAVPWHVAPISLLRAVHPDGDLAVARATAAAGAVMTVSSNTGTGFAQIGATGVRWWLQVYLPADRTLAGPLLDRAVEAGAEAVVLTVDTPVVASRESGGPTVWDVVDPALVGVNFDPGYDTRTAAAKALDLGPHDLDWLAARTGLPVVVKGVLRPDDARRCVQAGAAAVWVSNHGGRQLDRAVATASCLPAVVDAVAGDAQVYVDGGLRRGLDVLTALALGADAVFLGRPVPWALAEGEPGVSRLHAELRTELTEALRLAGCRGVADTRGLIAPVPPTPR
ncbi:alpha-hydroxy acid oxidase [Nocardioides sp. SYSU D00038]|uniref:alpha-hydroxy acid oxidase n=1 Tax=Nocardioides sp. SYSU D00038 TaxID=2812554 RepID=UPI0019685101|nr:alpha-hydroxy acid oxidase [Nocardioides sp. SYSU D00038]